jgi:hypothetical protein
MPPRQEKKKASKWLVGCGIGCGAIVLIVIALIVGSTIFLRGMVESFESAVEIREVLDERFGEVGSFVPPADGAIPADRMEKFLTVRDATADAREGIERLFRSIPMTIEQQRELEEQSFWGKLSTALKIGKDAMGLGPGMGDLFDARNRTLVEQGMGMGEYTYIYVLAYYSYLGHSPEDGPDAETDGDVEIDLGSTFSRRVHRDLVQMMKNQLAALPEGTEPAWRAALEAEIAVLEPRHRRQPWADGLPGPVLASLEPHRERLLASWSAAANPFELARNKKRGAFSFTAE